MHKYIRATSIILIIFFSFTSEGKISIEVSKEKELLSREIFLKISNEHFFRNQQLDNINLQLLQSLLKQLDPEKIYFTKNEVASFRRLYSSSPSEIDISSSYELINLYFNRLTEATNYQLREVKKDKFNFFKDEEIIINNDLKEWQTNKLMLQKMWRKLAKNDLLTSMLANKDLDEVIKAVQKRYKNKLRRISQINDDIATYYTNPKDAAKVANLVNKDLDESIKTIQKRYKNRLRRISQRKEEDVFSIVMNNLTGLFDPHSSYFSPKSAEDFEMTMSLKLEGIGALLSTEDDYPIIVSIVPGGPAEKSGQINPDDKIVKITQLEPPQSPSVDVVGWRIDEVVQLIRGNAGTDVELELIPAKTEDLSERKWVTLTREEVKLEEQAAKSKIFEIQNNFNSFKIGVIDLPAFYMDFVAWQERDPSFRSSSKDVETILNEFNTQGVDGVIIDLRGNSGGSLYEANKLTSLFVPSGATLQVKQSTGYIRPWGDARANQIWQKPMAVMVDRYSASASEIFAGAIQDYQRGLIIGHRTFGKGTVQKLDDLSSGQLKITESKFYRITGSGMQHKGISPDIVLPATWDIEEIGESSLDAALPWDQISPTRFKKFQIDLEIIDKLKKGHLHRIITNPNLQYLLNIRERYDSQKNKDILSLNIYERKAERIERQKWALNTENKRRSALGLKIFETYEDLKEFNENKKEIDIDIENDFLLNEGTVILSDFIYLNQDFLISEAA